MSKTTLLLSQVGLYTFFLVIGVLLYLDARQTQPLSESEPTQPVYVDDGVTFYPKYQSINTYQNKVVVHLGWTEDDTQNQFLVWNPIIFMLWLVVCSFVLVIGASAIDTLVNGQGKIGGLTLLLLLLILAVAYLMWYESLYAAAYSPIMVGIAAALAVVYLVLLAFVAFVLFVDSIANS